jgi:alkanesulfonate monooxygenase
MQPLEFGWFLPTSSDTLDYGDPDETITTSPEHLMKVVAAVEAADFDYMLIPVARYCWEAVGGVATQNCQRVGTMNRNGSASQ